MHTFFACLRDRWPFRHILSIPPEKLRTMLRETEAEPWHYYAIQQRCWRRHICIASGWLADALPQESRIFEPGCGSGANLIWLAQRGFTQLLGADISHNALRLCHKLTQYFHAPLRTWQDNSLQPARLPDKLDAILSVNWLYHLPDSSLPHFLETYSPSLRPQGLIALDMISARYNQHPCNQYHTDDWKKPQPCRRPSEYRLRYSMDDVAALAHAHAFQVVKTAHVHTCPPRDVYLLRKTG